MPILSLQRQLTEQGRIRIGVQVTKNGKSRPEKLETFRFTTASRDRADSVASAFGGEVVPWLNDGRDGWEVITPAKEIPVLIPPGQPVSQWFELWSGGGCQRRCDGVTEKQSGKACLCPADPAMRSALSATGQACKPTTRLNVMLRDVLGVGVWRLESHGFYAAVELAGMAELLSEANARGVRLPATLRLEQRSAKRDGQTRRYAVPVLDVGATPAALLGADTATRATLTAPDAALALPAGSDAQAAADAALAAPDSDSLRAVYVRASEHEILEAEVIGRGGEIIRLYDLILARRADFEPTP